MDLDGLAADGFKCNVADHVRTARLLMKQTEKEKGGPVIEASPADLLMALKCLATELEQVKKMRLEGSMGHAEAMRDVYSIAISMKVSADAWLLKFQEIIDGDDEERPN